MKERTGIGATIIKVLLTIAYGLPLFWILLTSIKSSKDVFGPAFDFEPTLAAYDNLVNDALWTALKQSIIIATGTTLFVLLIAVPAAYGLSKINGWVAAIGLGALIVFQISPQTANLIPLFQIFGQWHLLDSIVGVIIADTALLTPFAIMLLRPFFKALPIAIEEAAEVDGAGMFQTFFQILLPMAKNGVYTVGTLVFLLAWGEFLYAVNFFLSPGTYPLSALLSQQVSAFGVNWPGLMALAVLTSIPILIVYSFAYRSLRDGLTVGAVK